MSPLRETMIEVTDQAGVDATICNYQRTIDNKVPSEYKLTIASGVLDETVGISTTGSLFFNAMTPENIDPVHPL